MEFLQALTRFVQESGETANSIAVRAGVSPHTVANILAGKGTVEKINLIKEAYPQISEAMQQNANKQQTKGVIETMQDEIDQLKATQKIIMSEVEHIRQEELGNKAEMEKMADVLATLESRVKSLAVR